MKELIQQLSNISDAYDDFILGVINYAKKNPDHLNILTDYLRNNSALTSSDVIAFIINQPDFHSYSATNEIQQVG